MSINPDVFAEMKRDFERTTSPFVRVKKSPDEVLRIFHEMGEEFKRNSFFPYELAKMLTAEQAGKEIPLYLQFLVAHPFETLNEPLFWVGMRENPAIHDSYIAAALAATFHPRSEKLITILSSAYHYKIPELVAKVLAHAELTPLKELFEVLFSNSSADELKSVLDRFAKDPALPSHRELLLTLILHALLPQLKEMMPPLQSTGLNVATLICENPSKALTCNPTVSHLEYLLGFLSVEEQARVLDVTNCQYILNMAILAGEIDEIQALLEFYKARQLPLQTILTQKMAGNPQRSLIEKLQANRLNDESLNLMQSYLTKTDQ